jgi:UDPglucose--hexose-1-phosphate uridylyltransferase
VRRPPEGSQSRGADRKPSLHHPIEDSPALLEIPDGDSGDWHVKVVPSPSPAFAPSQEADVSQEVVLETPRLGRPFHQLSVTEIEHVLTSYQHRVAALSRDHAYVSVFKNHGAPAGSRLAHTHSHIVAMDIIPPGPAADRIALTRYQHTHGTSALCDIIRHEMTWDQRIIIPTRHTTTICPYASQFPLEAWIIPHRQCHSITDLSAEEIHSVADHLKGVTVALGSSNIDFNYHLMESVPDSCNHFYLKVTPRLEPRGGFELNTAVPINPVSPEFATDWYRRHIKAPYAV